MKGRGFIFIVYGILMVGSNVLSQNTISFGHLDKSDGLSNNTVNDIKQDSLGYLWISTTNGLNKFDGTNFTQIKSSTSEGYHISHIRRTLLDSIGNLYIGSLDGGLYYFNVKTNQLQLISNEVLEIHDLTFDKLGRLWVGAMEGLFLLERSFEKGFSYKQYSHKDILSILPTNDKIWFSTNTGVEWMDINLESNSENTSILEDEYVFDIKLVNEVQLWMATRYSGLLIYDIPGKSIQTFSNFISKKTGMYRAAFEARDVRKITKSSSGKIYIGTVGDGLLIYDLNNHELVQFTKSVNRYNISGNTVLSVFEDRDNNLWLGHARKGISVIDNNRDNINVFYNQAKSEDYSSILYVYEDRKGNILYGTDGEGLFKVNDNEKAIRLYTDKILQNAYVQCIFKDSRRNVWIGTFSKGLMVKTPDKKQLNIPVEANDIRGFVQDKHNNIWIATYGLGLFCYNLLEDSYSHYKHSLEDPNSISSNIILKMLLHQGDLYLATYGGGVNVFNTNTRKAYSIKDVSENGKTGANIISIAISRSDDLWVGSSLGITNIKRDNDKWNFNNYSFNDLGFKGHLRALIIDDREKIWFSTDNGIYELNINDSTIFKVNLGYLNNQAEFHLNSAVKLQNGKLYFGSTSGLFSFHPENVYDSHIKPKMLITGFKTLGKRKEKIIDNDIKKLNIIRQQGKVIIEPWINLFTVEFISLQLPSSKAVEYSVKLEGFDEDWRNIGSNTEATYTNLPPGNYKFKVQSNDIRGNWSNNTTAFEIEVLTPIWKSWGAILIYFSVFLLILITAQRYSVNWNEMKNNLKLEKLNREKDEEIHRMQLAFFTNISHDLRTPLTLIVGNLKRLMSAGEISAKSRTGYNVIENNVNRLLRLANELLDFRKIETGNLKLNVVKGNLALFIREIYYSFYDHAGERNIKYNLLCDEEEINIFFDYDQMEKVMFNLLSNAFKYTPNQGEVSIIVSNTDSTHVGIEVKNTGHILSESQQQKIFNRFYQSSGGVEDNDIGPGNGIGLSIVNDIVNLHKGTIEVSSTNKDGTKFRVLLPKGDVHVKQSERETFIGGNEDIGMYRRGDSNMDSSVHQEDKSCQGATVLVVEDNFELRKFIASSLENHYKLLEAENGKQALELAKNELPDIIVSDVMMPEMDGITMCFKLKTDVKTSHIPVILLTARKSRYYKVKGLETGADDYISKPFYEDELKIRIKNHLKLRHDLRQKYLLDASLRPEEVVLSSPDEKFIKDLCVIIEKNMDQSELKAEDISKELAMSHSLVYKKLKAITGMSIVEFVRDFRLKKAESLLIQDKLSVSDVCYMVGFNNRNYFSAWFKKKYKASPRDYVKSHLGLP